MNFYFENCIFGFEFEKKMEGAGEMIFIFQKLMINIFDFFFLVLTMNFLE